MTQQHTPTPWERDKENAYRVLTPGGGLLAETSYHWVDPLPARLNAAYIVKACNAHEDLVRTVQNLLDDIDALKTADNLKQTVERSRSWFSVVRALDLLDDIRTT